MGCALFAGGCAGALWGCGAILGIDDVYLARDASTGTEAGNETSHPDAAGNGADAGGDATAGDDTGTPPVDGGAPNDGAPVFVPSPCAPGSTMCTDAAAYAVCADAGQGYAVTTCMAGCSTSGGAHCQVLQPSPPVSTADLTTAGVMSITIASGTAIFNTNDGSISGALTRGANALAGTSQVIAGIAFRQGGGVGIWTFADLTVAKGATVTLLGVGPAALVAEGSLSVLGVIDARPTDSAGNLCPSPPSAGPGASAGGTGCPSCGPGGDYGAAGLGPGGGGGGTTGPSSEGPHTSGGGAGHAAAGGAGGTNSGGMIFATAGGSIYVDDAGGGSGGGGGLFGGFGGGGGGAVTLVAGYVISIGNGQGVAGVNAGGCGGSNGGGGGSGGTIVLEAPFVQLQAQGVLAANGGGGGAAQVDASLQGNPGGLGAAPALGYGWAPTIQNVVVGCPGVGAGGAGNAPAGGDTPTCAGASGGGGGAAGYVFVRTMSGTPAVFASQAVISPSLDAGSAFGSVGVR
jgi:hypothetical protein